jgi:hypothetical protein
MVPRHETEEKNFRRRLLFCSPLPAAGNSSLNLLKRNEFAPPDIQGEKILAPA